MPWPVVTPVLCARVLFLLMSVPIRDDLGQLMTNQATRTATVGALLSVITNDEPAGLGTAHLTNAPPWDCWAVARIRLEAVSCTPDTVTEEDPACTTALPLSANTARPCTRSAVPFVLVAWTPVPSPLDPTTPTPAPLSMPLTPAAHSVRSQ